MDFLRVPLVSPALFSGEGASAECQACSAPCNGLCVAVCAAAVAGKMVFKAVLVLGRGHGKQQVRMAELTIHTEIQLFS